MHVLCSSNGQPCRGWKVDKTTPCTPGAFSVLQPVVMLPQHPQLDWQQGRGDGARPHHHHTTSMLLILAAQLIQYSTCCDMSQGHPQASNSHNHFITPVSLGGQLISHTTCWHGCGTDRKPQTSGIIGTAYALTASKHHQIAQRQLWSRKSHATCKLPCHT